MSFPSAHLTWLVYRPAYERRLRQNEGPITSWIADTAAKYGAKLIWFNDPETLVNYLNGGQPRDQVKISNLDFFLHSNKACFMFDYSNEIDSGFQGVVARGRAEVDPPRPFRQRCPSEELGLPHG